MMQIFAIRDRALNAFMRPFFAQSTGQAVRMFQDLVNEPGHDVNKHPDDYDLYLLGDFNDDTGTIGARVAPEQVAIGKNLLNLTK